MVKTYMGLDGPRLTSARNIKGSITTLHEHEEMINEMCGTGKEVRFNLNSEKVETFPLQAMQ